MNTPVLFLVFNRPQHAEAVLDRIRAARPPRLYLHADGARPDRAGEAERVAATRQILEKIDWDCQVFRLYRDQNLGMREGVAAAISWFFQHEEQGVILEDDSLCDPSFFQFCEEILEKYRSDERVMHVGGSNLLADRTRREVSESYFFTGFSFVWGWAGWRRAWQKMSLELDGLADFEREKSIEKLLHDPLAQAYLLDKFWVTRHRKNKSWAYAWQFSVLKNNGLCIVPTVNLVENTGIGDPAATNTSSDSAAAKIKSEQVSFPLRHPERVEKNHSLDQQFFYRCQKPRFRLWFWWLKKRLLG